MRALPGTLEVNVLRMVGRCLVCSRLISTWVSSPEPPPSTPSTVLHHHHHRHHQRPVDTPSHRFTTGTDSTTIGHYHQHRCIRRARTSRGLFLRRSKFMSVSYVSPLAPSRILALPLSLALSDLTIPLPHQISLQPPTHPPLLLVSSPLAAFLHPGVPLSRTYPLPVCYTSRL